MFYAVKQFPWTYECWVYFGSYISYSDKATAKVNNLVKQHNLKHTALLSNRLEVWICL